MSVLSVLTTRRYAACCDTARRPVNAAPDFADRGAIAFCKHNGGYLWAVSHEDEARVAQYIRPQEADWRKSHPSRAGATIPYPQFPTPKDRYRLSIDGRMVTVHEDHSGAHGQLDLSDSER